MSRTYRKYIRSGLFMLPADRAHQVAKAALRFAPLWELRRAEPSDPRLAVTVAGLRLRNPIGLAAGFDKDGEMLRAFAALGFGYISPGTIRDRDDSDASRPNIVRRVEAESLVNCVGIPSKGGESAAQRIGRLTRARSLPDRPAIIANIGGFTVEEYVRTLEAVQPVSDAIEIMLLCPNERYDRFNFLRPENFRSLMTEMNARKTAPFFVKIRNHVNEEEHHSRRRLVELCLEFGVDGITMPGSRTVEEARLSLGRGNLSGRATFEMNVRNVRELYAITEGKLAVKALGGVSTARDAFILISAGASTVELLTGLVYQGWGIAREIAHGLARLLTQTGIRSIDDLHGSQTLLPPAEVERRVRAGTESIA